MTMLSVVANGAAILLQAATPQAAPQTMQARFDAATKAGDEGRCAEAVALFDGLAGTAAAQKNPTVAGAIAARRGRCLYSLDRNEEAEASLRAGIRQLTGQAGFEEELRLSFLTLARMAALRLDYTAGVADANHALALAQGANRVSALFLLAGFTRFDGDGAAVRYSAEGLTLTEGRKDVTKAELAGAQTLAARALMAAGRIEEANALLKRALANNGGLTTRSSLSDIATRYDLAQAALLLKRREDARLYLAYTGAGRISDAPFAKAAEIDVPECSAVPGMTPDSYAVVEFSLNADGSVGHAEPIYAQGNREIALSFARAVQSWSWTAERAKAIPAFYRVLTRVELRCTRAGDQSNVLAPLQRATLAWAEGRGASTAEDERPGAEMLPVWRSRAGGAGAEAALANLRLARSSLTTSPEDATASQRLLALTRSLDAPQSVRTLAEITAIDVGNASRATRKREVVRKADSYRALLARPEVAAEPVGAATLRLLIANWKSASDRDSLLQAVATTSDLPAQHPLKVEALLAQANAAAASGDLPGAAALFAKTGLDQQQCALIGPSPAVRQSGATSSRYPMDLVEMGFEGWVKVEYDIAADGRTAQQRTLIAYPPFLFGDAAKDMIANTRFERSYRPESGVACLANQRSLIFRIPR